MTIQTREIIEKAYEAGRTAGLAQAADREKCIAILAGGTTPALAGLHASDMMTAASRIAKEIGEPNWVNRPPKTTAAPKTPNAPTISRGVKKATVPRTKGVKEGILGLLSDADQKGGVPTAHIIKTLGFKETSVRGTLMNLKKQGLIAQANGRWVTSGRGSSNSETEQQANEGFYGS